MKISVILLDEILIEACRAEPADELLYGIKLQIGSFANHNPDVTLNLSEATYAYLQRLAQKGADEPDVASWLQVVDAMVRSENV